MTNLFEKAARGKYRFKSSKGLLTVEQLWDLNLTGSPNQVSLNQIAIDLNKEIKETQEESFVVTKSQVNQKLLDMFEIVKYIIQVLVKEKEDRENSAKVAQERQKLVEILARKQEDKLQDLSEEDIIKRLNELK